MKKIMNMAAGLSFAALAVVGCARVNDIDEPEGHEITITASFADEQTKTTLQNGGTKVYWEAGDEIKVFYGTEGSRFTSTSTSQAESSDFSGSLNMVFGMNEGVGGGKYLWAVYPYRADAVSDGESVTTTLPSEQTGRPGSFAKSTSITLAKSSSFNMGFYNVCGGVRFSLTQEGVKEVVFESLDSTRVAGKVKIGFEDGVPVVLQTVEPQYSITLTAPASGTFEVGKWYYIVALPGTLAQGFKMTFNTDSQYATLKSSKSVTIKRGVFGSLADADEGLIFKDNGTPEPSGDNIVFVDNVAKVACLEKFDTDGDGEISYDEAAAVTSIAGLFTDYNTVTRFDELKYFTGITNMGAAFKGLTALKSVTIPAGFTALENYAFDGCTALDSLTFAGDAVKTIGNYAFRSCTSLKTVDIPDAVTSIGQYVFKGCSSLQSVEIPSGITEISYGCFQNCTSLETAEIPSGLLYVRGYAFDGCKALVSIDLPSGLKIVADYAFRGCTKFTSVSVPNSVTSLGSGAFQNCTALEYVALPSGIATLNSELFSGCSKLYSVTFPTSLTTIGNRAFYNCPFYISTLNISKIDLPETVTSIGTESFNKVKNVLVHSTSTVSISSNSFNTMARIFVPDAKVEIYKIRTNWSNYADHIYPLSTYSDQLVIEAVDLGLSVKWATCNVGGYFPEDYGDYYAWGETETKDTYSWSTYKWCNGTKSTLTKYNTKSDYGTVDNKAVLDAEDDVAHVNWGGSWRMPTDAEWTELRENCTWEWTTVCGVNGRLVTSNKEGYTDKSIFLPAAGVRSDGNLGSAGSYGNYWSSALYTDNPGYAWYVGFYSSIVSRGYYSRYLGQSVRPVSE